MRIFFVTTEMLDPESLKPLDGGLASYLCKITVALQQQGHDISVILANETFEKKVDFFGVKVFFVPVRKRGSFIDRLRWKFITKKQKQDLLCKAIHLKIREEHSKRNIDLIQYASYQSTGRFPEKDIPSCVRISSFAKLWQKNYNNSNKLEIINEITQFRNAKFLFGPSEYIANYIKQDLGLSTEIEIIETPFVPTVTQEDGALLSTLQTKIGSSQYLIFYGSIGLLKGAQEIADVIFEVLNKYPSIYFVLVGKEKKIKGCMPIQLIKEKAAIHSNRVIHFEKTGHAKLFPLIKAAKAVVLPSRIDNLPNACIEAMGLKKIVIGSRGASFEQLIDDGVNGILCEASNAKSLQVAIDRLMQLSDYEINQMENAAFERSKRMSLEVILPQLIKYYQKVITEWEMVEKNEA